MARKTNAVRLVEQAGVPYELRTYELDIEAFSAAAVAELIAMETAAVFKTLLVLGDRRGHCFAVVPGDAELDFKALANASGDRKVALVPVRDVEPLTGYRRGSVTAIGAKKRLPVFLDESAARWDAIGVSGGGKGLQMVIHPSDYVTLTGASYAPIARRA